MVRRGLPLSLIVLLSGCSTLPGYVLATKQPGWWKFESTPISVEGGAVLLYDRAPWVAYENKEADGSVWVHYAIVLNNTTQKKVSFRSKEVALIDEQNKESAFAVYDPLDHIKTDETVPPKTCDRQTVSFHLSPDMTRKFENSSHPLEMRVPLQDRGDLKLSLWLWKE